ncbi:wax ester/triacylglycerol synthase family O-acyltransferase [Accumulibacter sp.]|uniref:wax ester/triacylglycerol synthase family O-acyltransferase n=1 Tax=Accumulibacter sp. TaxID=2053492 RepID=UPI0025E6805D|nr:wax ester/triacylglycerol synthase family O-acyltransferase [Accumulibacter sp.]MCM8594502.1 wax ester/triacylglycerol synthase family O-acyltransferase [Accumulibacter sp.]MCM8626767.1 wax ester/triacylglycerol synthase family O-acyltransferase [Accumulibacter sp.]MDS4048648.1 wax ester/triacylglycerol synthase family O-acyltransferase [Accumulibacter sp.]
MSKLSLLDVAFFIAESQASPKHVGGLMICKRPSGSRAGFAEALYREFLTFTDVQPPFNRIIEFSLTSLPSWRESESVELAEHVHYHRLRRGHNGRPELYRLVSDLHQPMLDRSRPLWELHLIDGLSEGRFALYLKMHHACADGVTMMRWAAESLSRDAGDLQLRPLWSIPHLAGALGGKRLHERIALSLLDSLAGVGRSITGVARLAAMLFLESVKLTKNAISLPFVADGNTPLTGQVTAGRQFATTSVAMQRVNLIRERTRSTLNHVALTCIDGALHRYLGDQGVELQRPITIQMPVNLRKDGELGSGNKIGIIQVELSTPTDDPYVRLRNIGFSLRNVRTMIDSVAPEAIVSYTLITGVVGQLAEMLGLSNSLPPTGNTLVSNVPGPREYLYIKGARLDELHPISTLPAGNLLNITLFSYAGQLYFGLVASDELPHLDRLSGYVGDAFTELEQSVLDAHRPAVGRSRAGAS